PLTLTGGSKSLTWTGNANNEWDLVNSVNWQSGGAVQFYNGDSVLFPDGGSHPSMTLSVTILPGSVGFNNSSTVYALSGVGAIAGSTPLTKDGTATVTLA